jgi:hypothetical protein
MHWPALQAVCPWLGWRYLRLASPLRELRPSGQIFMSQIVLQPNMDKRRKLLIL